MTPIKSGACLSLHYVEAISEAHISLKAPNMHERLWPSKSRNTSQGLSNQSAVSRCDEIGSGGQRRRKQCPWPRRNGIPPNSKDEVILVADELKHSIKTSWRAGEMTDGLAA
jgi:hypothetical protein